MSSNSKNRMPKTKPTAAGIHSLCPAADDISMLGSINDHMLAATITPDAKPSSNLCSTVCSVPRTKYTIAAPSNVPKTGRIRMGVIV